MSVALPVTIEASRPAARRSSSNGRGRERIIRLAALRAPLIVKLVGANLVVVTLLFAAWRIACAQVSWFVVAAVVAVIAIHLLLALVALRPIRDLEAVVTRVWKGDFGARVERSTVADDRTLRVGTMFNILLDGLETDRARMRALASEVIEAGDRERAALARELHDSTAQRLAALLLDLSAVARDCSDPSLAARLEATRDMAQAITEEVRDLSHAVHPRLLDDLGLVAALQKLGREASTGTGIIVDVDASAAHPVLSNVASALYRVAQEAVRNATRHASPRHVRIVLRADSGMTRLEVHDDGRGFDLAEAERKGAGLGLRSMRERVSLLDGDLEIRTAVDNGTTIVATVLAAPAPAPAHAS